MGAGPGPVGALRGASPAPPAGHGLLGARARRLRPAAAAGGPDVPAGLGLPQPGGGPALDPP
eukprot:3572951-Alexandrium_andersonii.AAC.1